MTIKQKDLLIKRLILEPQRYGLNEPEAIKRNNDLNFCKAFFKKEKVDTGLIKELLIDSISTQNETELDLLLMFLEHFSVVEDFNTVIAELLIQPWHHLHDRIAGILEFHPSEDIVEYLYKGALYNCANLEYESDYCGFNRKCLYALSKIGTKEAIHYIKEVANSDNIIVSKYAKDILS